MDSVNVLAEKLNDEIQAFREGYEGPTAKSAYADWYEIAFYESYHGALTSDYFTQRVDPHVLDWINSKEKPLEFLYTEWISCDGELNLDWNDLIDWVSDLYFEDKRREKQDLYYKVQDLNISSAKDISDDYFQQFDYFCHITDDPAVFSERFPNNFDKAVDLEFSEFFKGNLSVKCCEYGCDTYPGGIEREVAPGCVQTYQQQVWNFIESAEQVFNCKCNYYDNVNGFEFGFEFNSNGNKGCYVFCAGNNGQEFSSVLYLTDHKLIRDPDLVKTLTTIDKALLLLLEENGLRADKDKSASLDEQIASASGRKLEGSACGRDSFKVEPQK